MPNTQHVCIYADRHGCGNREAHPYIASGGPVCDLHKPGGDANTMKEKNTMTDNATIEAVTDIPEDLIALELTRRERQVEHDIYASEHGPGSCRYALYLAEKAIATHPWMVERKTDWRPARKALKQAADTAAR